MGSGRDEGRMAQMVTALARLTALAGGVVLVVLVVLTSVSVSGRALAGLGFGPVAGDFELVEIGTAFAIFCFLPWCHLTGGHARVDLLAERLGPAAGRLLGLFADGLMLAAAVLIAWRLWLGMLDKLAYHETTFIREIPLWWAYAASLAGAGVFVVVAAWCLWRSFAGPARRAAVPVD